jgi:hypothetical protein
MVSPLYWKATIPERTCQRPRLRCYRSDMCRIDWPTVFIALATIAQAVFAWRLYQLQKAVEGARNACLLYVRVQRIQGQPVSLIVSNLSDYDLWVENVELFVTRTAISQPGHRRLGGDFHLSRGLSEAGLALQEGLIIENGNVPEQIDMDFNVAVRVWARDRSETRNSPAYRLQWGPGVQATLTQLP